MQIRSKDLINSHIEELIKKLQSFAKTLEHRFVVLYPKLNVFQSLIAALVLCRLDYGNVTLVGLPAYLVR